MSSDSTELKIDVQEPKSWSRRLTVTVPAARVQRTRSAVTQQMTRNARLPGFRQGKLPSKVIEQRFGPSIEQETLDRTIQEAYREALEAQSFQPISQGQVEKVDYQPGSDLVFEVAFEVQPTIELATTSGFTATRPSSEVGEDEVDSVLERIREDRAVLRPVEEGAKPDFGDMVTVQITELDPDGAPKEGEESRSFRFALGEGQAIPAIEESIMTLVPGTEGNFTVRYPEDFPDETLRGQEQFLRIELNEAKRKELPEVTDEFVQSLGDFADIAALKERIRSDLAEEATRRAEAEVRGQLISQIIEANPFEVPDSMVERYLDYMTGHSHAEGQKHNHTPEEEERISQFRQTVRPQAEASLKHMLVIDRLAEREGLQATQDEVDERVEKLAEQHGLSASEVWIQLEKSGQLETLEREITEDKVFDYLKSQNTVTE
jgi:trigger factor